jgi:inner membrane protein
MKWVSHKIVTGSIVFVCTGDIIFTAASMIGSIFPDLIEGKPDSSPNWHQYHRKYSHWFIPYTIAALIMFFEAYKSGFIGHITLNYFIGHILANNVAPFFFLIRFFFVGCIMHIFEDFFCGGVPSLNPRKHVGKRLFHVGSAQEYVLSVSILTVLITILLL